MLAVAVSKTNAAGAVSGDLRSLLMQAMTKAENGMESDHPNFKLLHIVELVGDG